MLAESATVNYAVYQVLEKNPALTVKDGTDPLLLMKGVKEAVEKEGFMGLFSGGFKAGAVGTSAALIFGYLASLVFNPKMKK